MNDKYLWDKTGEDPEIEHLEKVLSVFRYQETAQPALETAEIGALPERAQRWKFSFAFAFAACAAIVVGFSIWFLATGGEVATETDLTSTAPSAVESLTADVPKRNISAGVPADSDQDPTLLRAHTTTGPGRTRRNIARGAKSKKQLVTLTSEEKYAYEQLMLALTITGSKLKIVQDRVNGIEDAKTPLRENER